jgi:hypothetical protein
MEQFKKILIETLREPPLRAGPTMRKKRSWHKV